MNEKHVHPLPTQDITESQDTQTTQEIRNTDAGSGLHDADCCASDFARDDGVYVTSDGVPQSHFGSMGHKHFCVTYYGCAEDKFLLGKVDSDGNRVTTITSNYQGLLELRNLLNVAYDSLHGHVSPSTNQD